MSKSVFTTLDKYPIEKHRYTMAAQELVAKSRGRVNEAGHWRLADSKAAATVDDVSVFVIPVYQYYKEYVEWQMSCRIQKQIRLEQREREVQELNGNVEVHVSPAREVIVEAKAPAAAVSATKADGNITNVANIINNNRSAENNNNDGDDDKVTDVEQETDNSSETKLM